MTISLADYGLSRADIDGLLPAHDVSVSETPTLDDMMVKAYPRGLEMADAFHLVNRGLATCLALSSLWGAWWMLGGMFAGSSHLTPARELILGFVIAGFGLFVGYLGLRWDTSGYRYKPILFDRAARKVHIFIDHTRLLVPWPIVGGNQYEILSYDWDCVRGHIVSRNKSASLRSGLVPHERLYLAVFKAPDDPTIVDWHDTGWFAPEFKDKMLRDRWERLRRFMQEGGPPLGAEDRIFQPSQRSLWASLTLAQPFIGPGAKKNWQWRKARIWFVLGQLVMIPLLPLTMAFGLLRWVLYRLQSQPEWPAAIRSSVGDGLAGVNS